MFAGRALLRSVLAFLAASLVWFAVAPASSAHATAEPEPALVGSLKYEDPETEEDVTVAGVVPDEVVLDLAEAPSAETSSPAAGP